jgi:hypothetical protein
MRMVNRHCREVRDGRDDVSCTRLIGFYEFPSSYTFSCTIHPLLRYRLVQAVRKSIHVDISYVLQYCLIMNYNKSLHC